MQENIPVDKYAIYVFDEFAHPDPGRGNLWEITRLSKVRIPIILSSKVNRATPISMLQYSPGDDLSFWVIAHNRYGWGNNDPQTINPDETLSSYLKTTRDQVTNYVQPIKVTIAFP